MKSFKLGDEELAVLRRVGKDVRTPEGGWLRAVRLAGGVTQQQLATKLDFRRQAWAQLEASEVREAISLHSLRRAADAMEYDLVYFLVPRGDPTAKAGSASDVPWEGAVEPNQRPAGAETGSGWNEGELPIELR